MFINIKDARKHYGEGETLVNALDGVSLSLNEGRIYVILGPSGSGKSTLLNMIGGLDSLDSGEITIADRNISGSDKKKLIDYRREDVGFVFQFYNLIPDLTVQENIEVVSDISKNPLDMKRQEWLRKGTRHRKIQKSFSKRTFRRTTAESRNCKSTDKKSEDTLVR